MTLWRRPLRTNKDGFSFTGGMHLHSLEARATEPGLMKRKPQQLLGLQCKREGVRDGGRERERERGREVGWEKERSFFLLLITHPQKKRDEGRVHFPRRFVAD